MIELNDLLVIAGAHHYLQEALACHEGVEWDFEGLQIES